MFLGREEKTKREREREGGREKLQKRTNANQEVRQEISWSLVFTSQVKSTDAGCAVFLLAGTTRPWGASLICK